MSKSFIYGVGINDAEYIVETRRKVLTPEGLKSKIISRCPFYTRWRSMLQRCYDSEYLSKYPTYLGCSVCEDWLTFSNFKSWMETQDWGGKHLDKDLLLKGNKIYNEKYCIFLEPRINLFILDSKQSRGKYPIGVSKEKSRSKYTAHCSDPFENKLKRIGYYVTAHEAHLAWKSKKHEYSCMLADIQTDLRVTKALRERFL
jgi:hypothetical protein